MFCVQWVGEIVSRKGQCWLVGRPGDVCSGSVGVLRMVLEGQNCVVWWVMCLNESGCITIS